MHSYVLRCELKTTASIEQAFRIFENPYNLASITPPWLSFRIVDQGLAMRKGLIINYRIKWLGMPMRWRTVIKDYRPPYRFVDYQAKGPYVLWHHTHRFETVDGGTLVSDEVRYVLPLGWLGRIAHWALVGRQLLGIFRYRQQKIAEMLGGVSELAQPTIERASAVSEEQLADYRAYQSH